MRNDKAIALGAVGLLAALGGCDTWSTSGNEADPADLELAQTNAAETPMKPTDGGERRCRAVVEPGEPCAVYPSGKYDGYWGWPSPLPTEKLDASVEAALGDHEGNYFVGGSTAEQVLEGLSAPDANIDAYTKLDDGNYRVVGRRHHSSGEKSAIIATPQGDMLAAGMLHYRCGGGSPTCSDAAVLTVFVKSGEDRTLRVQQLQAWAELARRYLHKPIVATEVIIL